ncbi:MAG TPA: ABC transporter substrate-binding protein [Burkholderiales bacterium]|nr:ABC transporter substrate-binding protein [Burkholderiales bacterium]
MRIAFCKLVAALLVGVVAGPVSYAQQAGVSHRVGLVFVASPIASMAGKDPAHPSVRAFVRELRKLGYAEGKNLVLERRSAEGRSERIEGILKDLLRREMDVIVTAGNDVPRMLMRMTGTVPIVMATSRSPLESGLVTSLARPEGNVTGLSIDAGAQIEARRLDLLTQVLPGISRVAFLGTRNDWGEPLGQATRAAASTLGVALSHVEVTLGHYEQAFATLARERPDAVFVANSASNFAHRARIADFLLKSRLPAVHPFREIAEGGGLMSYGANVPDLYRRAAGYVDRILKGIEPGELPVEQPTKYDLVINLKTAALLDVTIPQSLLLQADELLR